MDNEQKYYQLLLNLISNNVDKSMELYYLVLGFVGNG